VKSRPRYEFVRPTWSVCGAGVGGVAGALGFAATATGADVGPGVEAAACGPGVAVTTTTIGDGGGAVTTIGGAVTTTTTGVGGGPLGPVQPLASSSDVKLRSRRSGGRCVSRRSRRRRRSQKSRIRLLRSALRAGCRGRGGHEIGATPAYTALSRRKCRPLDIFAAANMTRNQNPASRRFGEAVLEFSIFHCCRRPAGGDLTVESVHGQGSTFTVRLPAVTLEPA
jgi:hypothetical protein